MPFPFYKIWRRYFEILLGSLPRLSYHRQPKDSAVQECLLAQCIHRAATSARRGGTPLLSNFP